MAIDKWNGSGNWTGNPTDWSTGSPPGSTDIAEIQSGSNDLTSKTSVKSIITDSGTSLTVDIGASLTTTRGINNAGGISTNANGKVSIGGVLTNSGVLFMGGLSLIASTTVTAAGLRNTGVISLQGNATSGTKNQATLDITAAAPTTATGFIEVAGDAMLEFASGGITAIGTGAHLELDGARARVSIGSGTTNTALSGLASNAGSLLLEGGGARGAGGVSVTTTTSFNNAGTVDVDSFLNKEGGSTLTLGGTLTNSGSTFIGNIGLSAATTVTATGLDNSGTLWVLGNAASGPTNLATLDITSAAPATVTGTIRVGGDAMLEFASGAITAIGPNASLELDGAQARVSIGAGTTSTALSGLANNAGTLLLRGGSLFGAGGASVTTTTSFANTGSLEVDSISNDFGSDGGSTLTLGGTLTNSGSVTIGNTFLSAATTVTAKSLNNTGSVVVQGNNASGATQLATLDITGAAIKTTTGSIRVNGDAMLEFASGLITAIGFASTLELDGAGARVSIGSGTTSTALTKLVSNAGTFVLRGDTGFGAGGSVVTTTTNFSNTGTLSVDALGFGDGGSALTLGGKLTNSATVNIGNTGLSAATTVTAKGLVNNGSLSVQGNNASGATQLATLNITGAAPTTETGSVRVSGDGMLEFKSGGITAIAAGAAVELDGAQARISIGSGTTSTALSNLANNEGTLTLRGNSNFGASGSSVTTTMSFNNTGTLSVDQFNTDGGSSLTFGGTLTNAGTANIGNTGLSAATTVTAAGFNNTGTLNLTGTASHLAEVIVNGDATDNGSLNIGASTEFDVAGGHTFFQASGTTTVAGLLAATTIDANGGLLDFTAALTSGNGTGAVDIGADGTAQFDASVDSSHTVTFAATTGTLTLTAPASFAGTIAGFGSNDVIDLVSKQVTGLSYSGNSTSGVLTVTGSSGTIATLAFSGNYTTANFTAVSDGNGGTDIIDPPSRVAASSAAGGTGVLYQTPAASITGDIAQAMPPGLGGTVGSTFALTPDPSLIGYHASTFGGGQGSALVTEPLSTSQHSLAGVA